MKTPHVSTIRMDCTNQKECTKTFRKYVQNFFTRAFGAPMYLASSCIGCARTHSPTRVSFSRVLKTVHSLILHFFETLLAAPGKGESFPSKYAEPRNYLARTFGVSVHLVSNCIESAREDLRSRVCCSERFSNIAWFSTIPERITQGKHPFLS